VLKKKPHFQFIVQDVSIVNFLSFSLEQRNALDLTYFSPLCSLSDGPNYYALSFFVCGLLCPSKIKSIAFSRRL
jgi:hypothetical protein